MQNTDFVSMITGAALTILLMLGYSIFTVALCRKQDRQPLKSKSPRLLLVSLFANLLSVLTVCVMMVVATSNALSDRQLVWPMVRVGIAVSETIIAPIMYCAYVAR